MPAIATLIFLLKPDPTDKTFLASPGSFRSELHRRLSDWMLPVVFTLISLVVIGGARSSRRARLHPMVAALSISFGLKWLTFYVTNLSKNNVIVPLVYGVPIAFAALAILMLATIVTFAARIHVSAFMARCWDGVHRRLIRARGAEGSGGRHDSEDAQPYFFRRYPDHRRLVPDRCIGHHFPRRLQ